MKINDEIYKSKIKPLFAKSFYVSVATVNQEGLPHKTPIGSVVLLNKEKGIYFEKFTKSIPKNNEVNNYATLMVVNTSKWYWFKSLLKGRFKTPPAIRLVIKLGELRPEKNNEGHIFKNKVSLFKRTKGYHLLWNEMSHIREFDIIDYKPVFIAQMTKSQFS